MERPTIPLVPQPPLVRRRRRNAEVQDLGVVPGTLQAGRPAVLVANLVTVDERVTERRHSPDTRRWFEAVLSLGAEPGLVRLEHDAVVHSARARLLRPAEV